MKMLKKMQYIGNHCKLALWNENIEYNNKEKKKNHDF